MMIETLSTTAPVTTNTRPATRNARAPQCNAAPPHAAKQLSDLNVPGMGFHALTGDMTGRFSVTVSRNWRITFGGLARRQPTFGWRTTMGLERHSSIEPIHPGAFLAEIVIPGTRLTKTDIAGRLGVSRQTLHDVLAERQPVTPTLGAKLGKLFGNGAGLWIRMQAEHDVWRATTEVDVSAIETFAVEVVE